MRTTLGSLLTVVLLRTAHHNLAKLRVLPLFLLLILSVFPRLIDWRPCCGQHTITIAP